MKYRDYYNAMLKALYSVAQSDIRAQPTLSETTELAELPKNANWLARFAEEADNAGLIESRKFLGGMGTWHVRITAYGQTYVEEALEEDPSWGSLHLADSDREEPPAAGSERHREAIDSTAWTGRYYVPTENRGKLLAALRRAEKEVSNLPPEMNSQRAQAGAYIQAAITLAEAPEPQDDLIWELLNRANHIAGIASLFVSILTLFVAS